MTEQWTEEEKIPIKTSGGVKAAAAPPKEEAKADGAPAAEGEGAAAGEEQKAPEEPAAQPEE